LGGVQEVTLAASTTSQIRAQVASIYRKLPRSKVIGISTNSAWQGAERESVEGQEFRFVQCGSPLQVREAVLESEAAALPLVVITNLSHADLGDDILARFAKRRLYAVQSWDILRELFQAREISPKVRQRRWLAEVLIESAPAQGYRPSPSGVLDEEMVFAVLLRERLGFSVTRPDASDVLSWALERENVARYAALAEEVRRGLLPWIVESSGRAAELIFAAVESGYGQDVAAIGLACRVVFSDPAVAELREASVRFERFVAGRQIGEEGAQQWAEATTRLVERLLDDNQQQSVSGILDRADQILKEVKAESFAYRSEYSPAGFELRLAQYGTRLTEVNLNAVAKVPDDLRRLADEVLQHRQAQRQPERATKVEMSVRLVGWLAQKKDVGSFAEAADDYARDGGFVDWARNHLYGGEANSTLASAYQRLAQRVASRREAENKRFGELLANWADAGSPGDRLLKIEDVLKEVVAKVAESVPVLVAVVDGMSYAVFRELLESISAQGWIAQAPGGQGLRPVIAALPSITEASRASLLCGKLMTGTSAAEAKGFAGNGDLLRVTGMENPPTLFHKAGLTEVGADLAVDLKKEIASTKRKVVGVVVNAVDDHLAKGEQVAVPWNLTHIPILEQLFYAARDGGRAVVITSDHGHVIERQTTYRKSEPGERFRADDGNYRAEEILITGPRVLLPAGHRLVAPWSETLRYGAKKHGYHGGASPQECVVPLAVLSRQTRPLAGWTELPLYRPEWWFLSRTVAVELKPPKAEPPAMKISVNYSRADVTTKTLPLFPLKEESPASIKETTPQENWIERLMASPIYVSQVKLAGRTAPTSEVVKGFLQALDERGGSILRPTLAQRLGQPELRLPGIIAGLRRLLNVEGYSVLSVDEASETITLNQELLDMQFDLK
jgi:hypothetical protein